MELTIDNVENLMIIFSDFIDELKKNDELETFKFKWANNQFNFDFIFDIHENLVKENKLIHLFTKRGNISTMGRYFKIQEDHYKLFVPLLREINSDFGIDLNKDSIEEVEINRISLYASHGGDSKYVRFCVTVK